MFLGFTVDIREIRLGKRMIVIMKKQISSGLKFSFFFLSFLVSRLSLLSLSLLFSLSPFFFLLSLSNDNRDAAADSSLQPIALCAALRRPKVFAGRPAPQQRHGLPFLFRARGNQPAAELGSLQLLSHGEERMSEDRFCDKHN